MEQFKMKLKVETGITAILCIILAAFTVLGVVAEAGIIQLTPVTGDSHWQSMWRGLISGASFGVLAVMLFGVIRSLRALKDEKKLKKLYVQVNDERQQQVWTSARATSMQIAMLLGLVAGLIAGYFNMVVGITILAVEVIHAVIGLGFKLYYEHKL